MPGSNPSMSCKNAWNRRSRPWSVAGCTGLTTWRSIPASCERRLGRFVAQPREGHEERPPPRRQPVNVLGDLVTVDARQEDVEEHHVRLRRPNRFEGRGAVRGDGYFVTLLTEGQGQRLGGLPAGLPPPALASLVASAWQSSVGILLHVLRRSNRFGRPTGVIRSVEAGVSTRDGLCVLFVQDAVDPSPQVAEGRLPLPHLELRRLRCINE